MPAGSQQPGDTRPTVEGGQNRGTRRRNPPRKNTEPVVDQESAANDVKADSAAIVGAAPAAVATEEAPPSQRDIVRDAPESIDAVPVSPTVSDAPRADVSDSQAREHEQPKPAGSGSPEPAKPFHETAGNGGGSPVVEKPVRHSEQPETGKSTARLLPWDAPPPAVDRPADTDKVEKNSAD
jgi:hypothetical protein